MIVTPPVYSIGSWSAGGDGGITDANGVVWRVNPQGTVGIFDTADNRLNHTPFNEYDGASRSQNFDNPLPISITGTAQGPNPTAVALARRQITGLLQGGGQKTLTVVDADGLVFTMLIEKNGKQQATPQSQGADFDWQINAIAANPYKYGPIVPNPTGLAISSGGLDWSTGGGLDWSTGGGLNWGTQESTGLVLVTNTGDVEVWPDFIINAPTDGLGLQNPTIIDTASGNTLMFVDLLSLGDVVEISSAPNNRFVTKNGVPYRRNLQVAQWFPIPAGGSCLIQFTGISGGATARLTVNAPSFAIA